LPFGKGVSADVLLHDLILNVKSLTLIFLIDRYIRTKSPKDWYRTLKA